MLQGEHLLCRSELCLEQLMSALGQEQWSASTRAWNVATISFTVDQYTHRVELTPTACVATFPDALSIQITRSFQASPPLVFDVFTKVEHVSQTCTPFDETVTVCDIDLQVGGGFHIVMVTTDGQECSFRCTYLHINPPLLLINTWSFDGWPDVEAQETLQLEETSLGCDMTWTLRFPDTWSREHMKRIDGPIAGFEHVAQYLTMHKDNS